MWRLIVPALVCVVPALQAAEVPTAGDLDAATMAEHRCAADAQVRVRAAGATAADVDAVCDGARSAIAFLQKAGLQPPEATTIELVEHLPADLDGKAMGCYIAASRRVMLLSYRAFMETRTWFRVPVGVSLYRSAAAHEVAHAMVGCNAANGRLPLAAHEYVAYVAMFATMEPGLRQRILAQHPGRGLANTLQINLFVYLVGPLKSATESWRHYLRQTEPAAWLRDIVAGQVVEEWPSDGP